MRKVLASCDVSYSDVIYSTFIELRKSGQICTIIIIRSLLHNNVEKHKFLYFPFQQRAPIPDHREVWEIELVS